MKISRIIRRGSIINIFGVDDEWFFLEKYSMLSISEIFLLREQIRDFLNHDRGEKIEFKAESELLPPVVGNPGKIIGVGLNYGNHIKETGKKASEDPIFFAKFPNSLAGNNESVPIRNSWNVDYEGELGVIIGRRARDVDESRAIEYVGGFFIGNDFSARSLQYLTSQYLLGKTPDKFYPTGPIIATKDEIQNYDRLSIKTYVNGELRQNGNTEEMIFNIPFLISYLSKVMTLEAGDVISTGTPAGVIMGYPEDKRVWLKNGDKVEVEIDLLGRLKNRIVEI